MPTRKSEPCCPSRYRVCLCWDTLLQEADARDVGHALSFGLALVRRYPEAAIWIEREVAGEAYMFAILQGENLDDE
jgi:hypothetical protein